MLLTLLAGIVVALCVLLLARLCLGPRRRAEVDALARRGAERIRRTVADGWRWPGSRRRAARMADEAIRRARERRAGEAAEGQWEGNVYKPKSFKRPRKPH